MKNVELLSPAGDFQSLKLAVFGGANAVYFGAKSFNARAKAGNFGEDLLEAVAFCHLYGVKAYLTLNTLVENDEINKLVETAKNALECGIDAFIVQDFGVLNVLKNTFPDAEIHTSTQMAVNNYLGAIEAEKMGAKRVVLSRETNLEDIKLIKEKTNLEIEYFIQGALCVCFSGNCYLSSHLFKKSGNKGECLQPCRLPYKAFLKGKEIKSGYLLSAKDICLSNRLKELTEAGVDSFKIEGRLRRGGYVSAVTKAYRKIIDNNFKLEMEDEINIKKAFNRGNFVEGYLNGNGGIIDENIQGHIGIKIGEVINFKPGQKFNIVEIKATNPINKGDGLKFILNKKECGVVTAMDIKNEGNIYKITTTSKIPKGANVHLILDAKKELADLAYVKKLPINFKLTALKDKKLKLECVFNGLKEVVYGDVCEESLNKPLEKNEAYEQLSKLGDTNFYLETFNFVTDNVFVTKKQLNEIRRSVVSLILSKFNAKKEVKTNNWNLVLNQEKNIKRKETLEVSENLNSSADFLVVKPKNYGDFNYKKITHKNAYLYIPSFLRKNDICLVDNILNENKNLGVYAENIVALGYNRKTILGAKLNIKNIYAINELQKQNVTAIVSSPEISNDNFVKLQNFASVPVFKSEMENFDLMTLVHCPIKMLYNNTCANCKFVDGITYKMENGTELKLSKYVVKHCYFNLSKNVDMNCKILYT